MASMDISDLADLHSISPEYIPTGTIAGICTALLLGLNTGNTTRPSITWSMVSGTVSPIFKK